MIKNIAIIPARAGSKGIKDKNLITLQGKTLIRIMVDKLIESKIFTTVLLTTDYERKQLDIADVQGNGYTTFNYVKRPKELAKDETPMNSVVSHALAEVGSEYKYVWLFQPTCPFTRIEDITNILSMLNKNQEINSVISFKEVKEHSNRFYTMKKKEEYTEAYRMRYTNFVPRQKLMPQYIRSGNIYVTKREEFIKSKTLENKSVAAYFFDRVIGLNIDDQEDIVLVKYWLQSGRIQL